MGLSFGIKVTSNTKSLDRIVRQLRKAAGHAVQVGYFDGKTHPNTDGEHTEATIAAINEFGVPEDNIPERPFMMTTARRTRALREVARGYRTIISRPGVSAITHLLRKPGRVMQKEMSGVIRDFSDPANAPATIAKKGFDNPLVETGHLRDSVDTRIV